MVSQAEAADANAEGELRVQADGVANRWAMYGAVAAKAAKCRARARAADVIGQNPQSLRTTLRTTIVKQITTLIHQN